MIAIFQMVVSYRTKLYLNILVQLRSLWILCVSSMEGILRLPAALVEAIYAFEAGLGKLIPPYATQSETKIQLNFIKINVRQDSLSGPSRYHYDGALLLEIVSAGSTVQVWEMKAVPHQA
jgi:hypothetical protein